MESTFVWQKICFWLETSCLVDQLIEKTKIGQLNLMAAYHALQIIEKSSKMIYLWVF